MYAIDEIKWPVFPAVFLGFFVLRREKFALGFGIGFPGYADG